MPRRARDLFELFVLAADPASDQASLLASFRNARVLEPFPRRGGEAGSRWRRIIAAHERTLRAQAGDPHAVVPQGEELRRLGRDLFEALFPGEVRRLYDVARSLQAGGALDVVLTSMLDWVADKPWELAFDPSRREPIALSGINLVRNVFTTVPAERPRRPTRPLCLLYVGAQPAGAPPVSEREERDRLRHALAALTRRRLARIERLTPPTAERLQRRLAAGRVDVLHFVGHGRFDAEAGRGSLLLQDERGRPRPLGVDALRQLVCRRGIGLVFLNGCETGRGGRSDWTRGVAQALVAAGAPAVVANQYAVLDEAATLFAGDFYAQLARGRTLGDAAREARLAVVRERGADGIDWAVPVVFARDPREPLC